MDQVNELGKVLNKNARKAKHAAKKQQVEYPMGERARDIFDSIVPYSMIFRVPRKGASVSAEVRFELPPPLDGLGNCCSDCFCSMCEEYTFNQVDNQIILTTYPYIAGTVKVFDKKGLTSGVVETDPDAGIIDLNYYPVAESTNIITVCYIYKYDENCTTNVPTDGEGTCGITDAFNRLIPQGWGTSDAGPTWSNPAYLVDSTGVDGSRAWGNSGTGCDSCGWSTALVFDPITFTSVTFDIQGTVSYWTGGELDAQLSGPGIDDWVTLYYYPNTGMYYLMAAGGSDFADLGVDFTAPARWQIGYVDGALKARVWNTSGTIPDWQLSITGAPINISQISFVQGNQGSTEENIIYVENLDIAGVNRCQGSTIPPSSSSSFMGRPASSPIVIDSDPVVLIENKAIQGGSLNSPSGIGITIRNVTGQITIRNVDLSDLVGGIYISNCSGTLLIENVRSRNIGDGSIGSGHSNHIQLAGCSFSGYIRYNKFLGGRTEDMLSIWHSGGVGSGQELIVEYNQLQGLVADTSTARAWSSSSGTGIIISDGAGSPNNGNIIVRYNTLLTPGQVGIQHIDGPNIQTYQNTILGEKRANNNNPMTSWEGNPRGEVYNNTYYWTNNDDSHPSPWFDAYGSLNVHNNTSDPTLNATNLQVIL
jgi:hypothetical protein